MHAAIPSYTLKFSYYDTNLRMVNNAEKRALASSGCCSCTPYAHPRQNDVTKDLQAYHLVNLTWEVPST